MEGQSAALYAGWLYLGFSVNDRHRAPLLQAGRVRPAGAHCIGSIGSEAPVARLVILPVCEDRSLSRRAGRTPPMP